ncbi:low choriolytic enzyme-like [Sinocyclocheilus anshuiensis]|uniref:low choriolytic enzyme-like n=1 Tax=Sinocyclocheilus anshuiensis TaxID=1608454 RepID=UPI0007B9CD62|nr:PREDICTED: low choriolytic enzyme-like [Sinocyclocheilus anshuiensis]
MSDTEKTSFGCLWPKYSDGKIYVPYVLANHYSSREVEIIKRGLHSFSYRTCIHFFPRSNERDYISIESRNGCYWYVGRQGYSQTVSLDHNGCKKKLTKLSGFNDNYSELFYAFIFNREVSCSSSMTPTVNGGTPYDYSSVMQYERYAFSKNGLPTMIPIPNNNAALGTSTEMSQNDIIRINRLYQ